MITKINLDKVASYKTSVTLETDKKVNLIYGLNGTGKSTLSNFLHQRIAEKYNNCSIEGLTEEHDILVYNQSFIQDNFFEDDSLKGIFTLSKENKEAFQKLSKEEQAEVKKKIASKQEFPYIDELNEEDFNKLKVATELIETY